MARLQETLKELRLNAEATLGQIADGNPTVNNRLAALVKDAEVVDRWSGDDGSTQLLARLTLLGQRGLYAALTPLELARLSRLGPNKRTPPEQPSGVAYNGSGLVIDARGLNAAPGLFPRILTRSGHVIYDLTSIEPNQLVLRGLSLYRQSLSGVKADPVIGPNPLIIMADEAAGAQRVDLILEDKAGETVLAADARAGFLRAARIGVVID